MARVQVGEIIMRDEKGNFLPNHIPIYRDLPDIKSPETGEKESFLPIDDIAELFLPGFMKAYRESRSRKPSAAQVRLRETLKKSERQANE